MSNNLALNLLEAGFQSLDRVVVQLPNVAEFVVLYLALQKIGGIPIAALLHAPLPPEIQLNLFVELSGAVACVVPDQHGDFDYCRHGRERIRHKVPKLRHGIVRLDRCARGLSIASRA